MVLDHIGEKILPQRKEKLLSDIGRLIKVPVQENNKLCLFLIVWSLFVRLNEAVHRISTPSAQERKERLLKQFSK